MLGKIFGAGLGWVLGGGPIGAVIGLAIGSAFDKAGSQNEIEQNPRQQTQAGDFNVSLVILSAAVMKADGKILKSELDFVKQFFVKSFGQGMANEQVQLLKEVLKQELNLNQIAAQIRVSMRINEKRLIMQYLFGIAQADGHIADSEIHVLQQIAQGIGISASEFLSMRAMFSGAVNNINDYKVLGLSKSDTNEQIKKAYRQLVIKNHPDKVAHLGENHVEAAKQKFQKIQSAYSNLKKERGL